MACGARLLVLAVLLCAHAAAPASIPHLHDPHGPQPFFPPSNGWRPTWPRVPAMIFGANVTGPENATQLALDALYPLVVYGWQHEDNSSDWVHIGERLAEQCSALKAAGATSRCVVYRSVSTTQPWFDTDSAAMRNATRRRTWFLQNNRTGEPVPTGWFHPDPHWPQSQSWLWDHRNPEVSDYFVDAIVRPVATDQPGVDGMFFDMVDFTVCGAMQYAPCDPVRPKDPCGLPFPGGDDGMREYFDAVWRTMRRMASELAAHGKLGVFSSTNFVSNLTWAPAHPQRMEPGACIRPQGAANALMAGVPWARYYETWLDGTAATRTATTLEFNRTQCIWQVENALAENAAGVSAVMHTDVHPQWLADPAETPALLNVRLPLAAFLIAASEALPSYYGFSFGTHWYDASYRRIPLYDQDVGKPLGPARRLGCCDGDLLPHTQFHATSSLFNTKAASADECAKVCCASEACAGFEWTPQRPDAAGNCTAGAPCCSVLGAVPAIEGWSVNSTAGSAGYSAVAGIKVGVTWRRQFENVEVEVRCAELSGRIDPVPSANTLA